MIIDPRQPGEETRRFGHLFTIASWLITILLLTVLFTGILDYRENPNRSPKSSVGPDGSKAVVLRRNRAGHYIASGRINGKPVRFIIDTGATDVVLSDSVADELQLIRGARSTSRTASGTVSTWRTRLDRIEIGNITQQNVAASILPAMPGSDVLLGMSFLKRVDLVQQDDRLTIRQK